MNDFITGAKNTLYWAIFGLTVFFACTFVAGLTYEMVAR